MNNITKYLSKSSIKPELQSIYLTENKAIATDSFKLIEITRNESVEEPVIVRIPKGVRKIDNIDQNGVITNGINTVQGEIIDGNFPDYKTVMPKNEPEYEITFSPEHLAVIIESYKKEKSITLKFYGNEKPMMIQKNGVMTLLMPVKE